MSRRVRLHRSDCSGPGYGRVRSGKGFSYRDRHGATVRDAAVRARIEALAIPPAWTDVWICESDRGHLQAVGTDDAGRRQYLYHPQWREDRDREKHDRILDVARRLPAARAAVAEDLARADMSREHVLAVCFRLLDLGLFRVGGESYAADNGSYGLATLRRDHVRIDADSLEFSYVAKHGRERRLVLQDAACADALATLKRRRDGEAELFAWREDGPPVVWHDITSSDINAYVRERLATEATAKDFRTWHGTVVAARGLGALAPAADLSPTARKRAVAGVMRDVAEALGNTPAVARASYVDPRVVDLWEDGVSLAPVVDALGVEGLGVTGGEAVPGERPEHAQDALEAAVLDLLTRSPEAAKRRIRAAAREVSSGPVGRARDRSRA